MIEPAHKLFPSSPLEPAPSICSAGCQRQEMGGSNLHAIASISLSHNTLLPDKALAQRDALIKLTFWRQSRFLRHARLSWHSAPSAVRSLSGALWAGSSQTGCTCRTGKAGPRTTRSNSSDTVQLVCTPCILGGKDLSSYTCRVC